jgi:hypothetical protein
MVEERLAELMECSKWQHQLVFDAGYVHNPAVLGLVCAILQERGLTDARLTSHDESPAVAATHIREQAIQNLAFAFAAYEERRLVRHAGNLCRNWTSFPHACRPVLGAPTSGHKKAVDNDPPRLFRMILLR